MKQSAFFHSESCFWHTTGEAALTLPVGGWVQPMAAGGHAESPESKRRMLNLMQRTGLFAALDTRSAPPADAEQLARIHTASYLEEFRSLSALQGGLLGPAAPFGKGSFDIACTSAGLAIEALATVLRGNHKTAYALTRPPGHHCLAEHSMGFCLLANIPLAIADAREKGLGERFFVLDWDVHHGNGTQHIFYEDIDVHTLSIHQTNMFPPGYNGLQERGSGRGEGANTNVPLPPGCGHDAYLHAMRRIVLPLIRDFQPDAIIIASGYDASHVDPLARMSCLSTTYETMTAMVVEVAGDLCEGRVVAVHEGGYSEAYVPFCGHRVIEQLSGHATALEDPFLANFLLQQPDSELLQWQCSYIDRLASSLGLI